MRRLLTTLVVTLLIGCASPLASPDITPDLEGQADFGAGRRIQATLKEVGKAATVSLISTSTGQTIRTTLTNELGQFVMSFGTWKPGSSETYYLEAVKGLNNNQAGYSAARVRTLGKFESGGWSTLTSTANGTIRLTSTTTAVSIIASHLGTASVSPEGLLNTVAIGSFDGSLTPSTPDTFAFAGTGITNAQYHLVYGLVEQALTEDSDPMDRVIRNGAGFSLKSIAGSAANGPALPAPTLYTLVPSSGPIGSFITLFGKDFEGENASNSISFNGMLAIPFSSEPTKLFVQVPVGASSGPVTVRTRGGTSEAMPLNVTPSDPSTIGGSFMPR